MLTRAQVIALAEQHGLGRHAARLADAVRAGYRLDPEPGRLPASRESKIGGHPDLAAGEDWPHNSRGIAMTFVVQIDCSTLQPPDGWEDPRPWGDDGPLLRVFADLLDNPNEPGLAVALACDPRAPLTRTPAPALPDPFPDGGEGDDLEPEDRFRVFPEARVTLEPFLTAPEIDPELKPEMHDFSDPADRYYQWSNDVRAGHTHPEDASEPRSDEDIDRLLGNLDPPPWDLHHLLGEPASIQDDVLEFGAAIYRGDWGMPVTPDSALADRDAWRALVALHMDERIGLHIHDGGAFTILAPAADLARGRYDRLVCSVDSG